MSYSSGDPARNKIDNIKVIDYLVSLASALSSEGVLGDKEADNLGIVISGLQARKKDGPVLLELIEQDADFLSILDARYGSTAQALNLMRHSCRPFLVEILQSLSVWGATTLNGAELTFNRPIYVFHEGQCQRQQLLAHKVESLCGRPIACI